MQTSLAYLLPADGLEDAGDVDPVDAVVATLHAIAPDGLPRFSDMEVDLLFHLLDLDPEDVVDPMKLASRYGFSPNRLEWLKRSLVGELQARMFPVRSWAGLKQAIAGAPRHVRSDLDCAFPRARTNPAEIISVFLNHLGQQLPHRPVIRIIDQDLIKMYYGIGEYAAPIDKTVLAEGFGTTIKRLERTRRFIHRRLREFGLPPHINAHLVARASKMLRESLSSRHVVDGGVQPDPGLVDALRRNLLGRVERELGIPCRELIRSFINGEHELAIQQQFGITHSMYHDLMGFLVYWRLLDTRYAAESA